MRTQIGNDVHAQLRIVCILPLSGEPSLNKRKPHVPRVKAEPVIKIITGIQPLCLRSGHIKHDLQVGVSILQTISDSDLMESSTVHK